MIVRSIMLLLCDSMVLIFVLALALQTLEVQAVETRKQIPLTRDTDEGSATVTKSPHTRVPVVLGVMSK